MLGSASSSGWLGFEVAITLHMCSKQPMKFIHRIIQIHQSNSIGYLLHMRYLVAIKQPQNLCSQSDRPDVVFWNKW